jgi:hypothetical protein
MCDTSWICGRVERERHIGLIGQNTRQAGNNELRNEAAISRAMARIACLIIHAALEIPASPPARSISSFNAGGELQPIRFAAFWESLTGGSGGDIGQGMFPYGCRMEILPERYETSRDAYVRNQHESIAHITAQTIV